MQKEFASPARKSYRLLVEQKNNLYEASKMLTNLKDVDTLQNNFHNEDFSMRSPSGQTLERGWAEVTLVWQEDTRKLYAMSHCISVIDMLSHT